MHAKHVQTELNAEQEGKVNLLHSLGQPTCQLNHVTMTSWSVRMTCTNIEEVEPSALQIILVRNCQRLLTNVVPNPSNCPKTNVINHDFP